MIFISYGNGRVLVSRSCPTLCDFMECQTSPSMRFSSKNAGVGFTRSFSRDLPDPGIEHSVSHIEGKFFTVWATRNVKFGSVTASCEREQNSVYYYGCISISCYEFVNIREMPINLPVHFIQYFFLCVSFWTVSVAMFWNILMVSLAMSNLVMCFHQAMQFSSLFLLVFFVSFICLSNKINLSSNFWNVWNTGMLVSWPWGSWH